MPEFWTLNWMEARGYDADVFTEIDFESGIGWLQSYKALVLVNHPEYWTDAMRDRLDAFLAGGGNLLYLGGNGLFERCVLQEGGTSLLFFDGDPTRGRGPFYFNVPAGTPKIIASESSAGGYLQAPDGTVFRFAGIPYPAFTVPVASSDRGIPLVS
jgi:hypothetical protein